MSRKIKLIWDFKGLNAENTAKHHEIHLKEYLILEQLSLETTGFDNFSEVHSIAFMVVDEKDMILFRDKLKPHRAEVY